MSAYAVVQVGGHQYEVQENTVFDVQRFELPKAKETKLSDVLYTRKNGDVQIGQPLIKNASVVCEVVGEVKARKVLSFKFKRRKAFKKLIGHRQQLVRLKVKSIQTG